MKKVFSILSMILSVIAMFVGGGVMALNVRSYGSDGNDPNAGTTLGDAVKTTPEDKGGLAQHGQMSSGDRLQEAGLVDNKIWEKVLEYHARKYPFYTAMFSKATQFAFKGHKEAEYPEIGDIKLEARSKAAIGTSGQYAATITLTSSNMHASDLPIFRKDYTIFVYGVKGYDAGTTTQNNSMLELFITSADSNGVVCKAINGYGSDNKIPYIASGTLFKLAAPALAEEEVEVDPINVIPTMAKAYLQKKGYSVAITDFFNETVKEVDWEKDKIKRQALDMYKKIYTTTALFGSKHKFYKTNSNGVRLVYTQEGLMNQIRMGYQLASGKWTKADLIAISKLLFTAYTDVEEMEIFCGSDAMESLLNIDWGTDTNKIVYMKDADYKVEVATFRCSFGTLRFTHEQSLTENHLEKAAIAVPMTDSMRIYRDNGTTLSVDGKKGETGRVEELTKDYFVQDDCFVCNALNTMLIGPASLFSTGGLSGDLEETIKSANKISTLTTASVSDGDIYYLTEIDGTYDRGLYKASVSGSTITWSTYKREWEA